MLTQARLKYQDYSLTVMGWRFVLELFIICFLVSQSLAQDKKCPAEPLRVEEGRNCRKPCTNDTQCRGVRKNCLCDNFCGMTCYNPKAPCDKLPYFPNGRIEGSQKTYGNQVLYVCNAGHILNGTATRTCRSDRKWSGQPPNCYPGCLIPRDTAIAFADTYDDVFFVGAVVPYTCRLGHVLRGNPNVTCQRNGAWSQLKFICTKKTCKAPRVPKNVVQRGKVYEYATRVYFDCKTGYTMAQRQNYIVCGANAKWRGSLPTCEIVRCNAPIAPAMGSVDSSRSDFKFGSRVFYSCDQGYKLVGEAEATCLENGTWGEVPECVVNKDCDFENTNTPFCGYQHNSLWRRLFEENVAIGPRGYVARIDFSDASLVATKSQLTSPLVSRKNGLCLKFYYFVRKLSSARNFAVYLVNPDGVRRQMWRGDPTDNVRSWLSTDIAIKASEENVRIEFSVTKGLSSEPTSLDVDNIEIAKDEQCTNECKPNNPCQHDGQCRNRIGDYYCSCTRRYRGKNCQTEIVCRDLEVPNATRSPSRRRIWIGDSKLTFTCLRGYVIKGSPTVTCGYTGRWNSGSREMPRCERATCPQRSHPTVAVFPSKRWIVGDVATYSCRNGKQMIGNKNSTCLESGSWSSNLPQCITVKNAAGFLFIPARLKYDEAREHCQRSGGDLAVPKDQADINLITRTISTLQDFEERFTTSYYIGMKRNQNRSGDFYWINGTRVATRERESDGIHNWLRGEPNNLNNIENCAVVRKNNVGSWNDVSCNHRMFFICELPGCSVNPTPGMRVNPQASSTPIGERATFSCKLGYRLIGEKSMTCLPGAKWSHPFPACVATPKLRFQFKTQRKNYDDARETCRAAGGDLAQPRTREDIIFITQKVGLLRAQGFLYDFYFGMKRPGINKEFKWLNGTRVTLREDTNKSGISNWRSGEPNGPYYEPCAVVKNWHDGYWNDIPCWHTRYFICENEFNPCAGKPCRNEGRCIANGEHFRCDCPANKDGQLCEKDRPCQSPRLHSTVTTLNPIEAIEYDVGSMFRLRCKNQNHSLIGGRNMVCVIGSTWSNFDTFCRAQCNDPNPVSPIQLTSNSKQSGPYLVNDVIRFKCKNSTSPPIGNSKLRCLGSGLWSGEFPIRCPPRQVVEQRRECPVIPLSDHLRVEYNSGHRRVGSIAIFSCETNYKLKGSFTAVCRNTYSWSANAPVCEARGCRVTVQIPDGVIIDFFPGRDYSTNHQLPVRCKNSSPPTSDVITCQGAGVWRPSINSDLCN